MNLPLPTDVNDVPYLGNLDSGGNVAIPTEQYILSAGLYVPVSVANPLPIRGNGSLENIFDGSFAFANSAEAGTIVNVAVPLPSSLNKDAKYKLTVINPTTVTGLVISVQNKETISGTAYYPEVRNIGINAGESRDFIVDGLFGESARFAVSNYSALGLSDGFTGLVRIRRI